jgi:hypothetical protein
MVRVRSPLPVVRSVAATTGDGVVAPVLNLSAGARSESPLFAIERSPTIEPPSTPHQRGARVPT